MEELLALVEEPQTSLKQQKKVNHIGKRLKIGHKLRMNAQIGDYDMDYIILDLGTYLSILTRHTWESMGNMRLVWSPV